MASNLIAMASNLGASPGQGFLDLACVELVVLSVFFTELPHPRTSYPLRSGPPPL